MPYPTPEQAAAYRRLCSYAKKVARELAAARRPTEAVVLRPDPHHQVEINGWRFYSWDSAETHRTTYSGPSALSTTFFHETTTHELWLTRDGTIKSAYIRRHSHGNSGLGRGSVTVHEPGDVNASEMSLDEALRMDAGQKWHDKDRRSGATSTYEGWFTSNSPRPGTKPCLKVSSLLSDLRAGNQKRNFTGSGAELAVQTTPATPRKSAPALSSSKSATGSTKSARPVAGSSRKGSGNRSTDGAAKGSSQTGAGARKGSGNRSTDGAAKGFFARLFGG